MKTKILAFLFLFLVSNTATRCEDNVIISTDTKFLADVSSIEPTNIVFTSQNGGAIITFTKDGEIIVSPKIKPNKAAREFLNSLKTMYPDFFNCKDKEKKNGIQK